MIRKLPRKKRKAGTYDYAKEKFLAGEMLTGEAIDLMVQDEAFILDAEAMKNHTSVRTAAEDVVRNVWMPQLIERITGRKQEAVYVMPEIKDLIR